MSIKVFLGNLLKVCFLVMNISPVTYLLTGIMSVVFSVLKY